ncbi:TRAP transporter large permease [Granulosicoccus sp.]|nr:TRAP transporter large permease [Granulosicoccus sp.]MDB4223854.1 TRAP transporter large permease [Granulosicoccus sp.]
MAIELLVPTVFALMFVALLLGAHLGLAMSAAAIFGTSMLIGKDAALALAGISVYESAQSFDLSVIPLFVLMGTFASRAGISSDLFSAFNIWLRKRRGGLAHATIAACAAFGAVCGSSLATAATMGKVALPEMQRFGYSGKLATGSVAAGGTIGILIPPSVIMLIYGILTETSIGDLFIAGIIPGIILTLLFMLTVWFIIKLDPNAAPQVNDSPIDLPSESVLKKVWATLLLFALVIGGIYTGVFTPTEASGFGAMGALVIGVIMRRLNLAAIGECLMETVQTTSMIFLILIGAILFSAFVSLSGTPTLMGEWITGLDLTPLKTLIVIVITYMLLGAFMDTLAMIILSVPIFFPIVSDLGYDPVWFGVLVVIVVELALITPPLGINVFVIKGMVKDVSLAQVFAGVLPFCVALILLIALVIAVPDVVMFLPNLAR